MTETEIDYLVRRAAEELEYGERSDDPIAANIHRRMAFLYGEKIVELRHPTSAEIVEHMAMPQPSTSSL